jgi:hypothetical protein
VDDPSAVIGGWPLNRTGAKLLKLHDKIFTNAHSSEDGIKWNAMVGSPAGQPTASRGCPVTDTGVYFPKDKMYMIWSSLPTYFLYYSNPGGDDLAAASVNAITSWEDLFTALQPPGSGTSLAEYTNQLANFVIPYSYRYWSGDGINWQKDETYNPSADFTSNGRWETTGNYVLSNDGMEMQWISSQVPWNLQNASARSTYLWKADSPYKRTLVDQWEEKTPSADRNPFGRGNKPTFFKRINGVDAVSCGPLAAGSGSFWSGYGSVKSAIGSSPLPSNTSIIGFEYGMVDGGMAYVAYANDGNFYWTRDPSSATPAVQLQRPARTTCLGVPCFGNDWWIAYSLCDNLTYYTTKDLSRGPWFTHTMWGPGGVPGWAEATRWTPIEFMPSKDPKLAGKFIIMGNYNEEPPYIRLPAAAE